VIVFESRSRLKKKKKKKKKKILSINSAERAPKARFYLSLFITLFIISIIIPRGSLIKRNTKKSQALH